MKSRNLLKKRLLNTIAFGMAFIIIIVTYYTANFSKAKKIMQINAKVIENASGIEEECILEATRRG